MDEIDITAGITAGIPAIIEAARAAHGPEVLDIAGEMDLSAIPGFCLSGVPMLVTRDHDGRQHALGLLDQVEAWRAKYADRPLRRTGRIVAHTLESFVEAVNRDKREDSVIFADITKRSIVAVLDWHGHADSDPRLLQDRIAYAFQLSPQIEAWGRVADNWMDQKAFSRLIDDRASEIGEGPFAEGSIASEFARRRGIRFASIADLLVFTRTISTKSTVESEEILDENTGDVSIQFKKKGDVKTPDGKPLPVPAAFVLTIPILNGIGATQYNIPVRLRYDITESKIAWRIELHALDQFIRAAVDEAVTKVRAPVEQGGCGLPVWMAQEPAALAP